VIPLSIGVLLEEAPWRVHVTDVVNNTRCDLSLVGAFRLKPGSVPFQKLKQLGIPSVGIGTLSDAPVAHDVVVVDAVDAFRSPGAAEPSTPNLMSSFAF
jgi:hypothetical protein